MDVGRTILSAARKRGLRLLYLTACCSSVAAVAVAAPTGLLGTSVTGPVGAGPIGPAVGGPVGKQPTGPVMGPVGAGLAAKMINQLVVGVGHAMLAESVALCEKAGIDAARIPECLGGGYADSNLMKAYWPRMVERDFAPRGYGRQLLKDLEMVNAWAAGLDAQRPMLSQALFLYRELAKRGDTELDTSAIRKLYD